MSRGAFKSTVFGCLLISCVTNQPQKVSQPESLKSTSADAVIVAADQRAIAAGEAMLRKGGNAIDAAVAASFVLAVVRPQSTGLGGGGFLLWYDGLQKSTRAVDFRERAPATADPSFYLNPQTGAIAMYGLDEGNQQRVSSAGSLSVAVPGFVAGMYDSQRALGRLKWKEVLQPAIRLARDGFEVSPHLGGSIKWRSAALRQWGRGSYIWFHRGKVVVPGMALKLSGLARALTLIAEKGKEPFYRGSIAKEIVATLGSGAGRVDLNSLSQYKSRWVRPLTQSFQTFQVHTMPPPSAGGLQLIQSLHMLTESGLRYMGHNSPLSLHLTAEALRQSFYDRYLWVGDPSFVRVPTGRFLNRQNSLKVRQTFDVNRVRPMKAFPLRPTTVRESPSTAHVSVVDKWGNAVSTTHSINYSFGSGITLPKSQFVLNNHMDDFVFVPNQQGGYELISGSPNLMVPGKAPVSSMAPTLIFDGRRRLSAVIGATGGPRIVSSLLQFVLNLSEFSMDPLKSLDSGRVHQQWNPNRLLVEYNSLPPKTLTRLQQKGHNLKVGVPVGAIQAVVRHQDKWVGLSDYRENGFVRR